MKLASAFALVYVVGLTTALSCTSTTKVTGGSAGAGAAAGADNDAGPTGGTGGSGTGGSGTGGSGTGGSGGSGAAAGGASGGSGGSGGAGATGGSGGSGVSSCPMDLPGPEMVFVESFCIDSTEVTGQQYEAFVNAKAGDMSGQLGACAGNASFVPLDNWPIATDAFQKPVNYIDWCDAYEYCRWAGKRLCGKIGGGSNAYGDYADATKSQWHRVCSNAGRNDYPYGGTFNPDACNGYDGPEGCNSSTSRPDGTCTLSDVGSYPNCQGVGDYAGVYDLGGNLLEWEDSCMVDPDGGVDICRLRGGAIYAGGPSDMTCDTDSDNERLDNTPPGIGFRCCYD